MMKPGIQAVTTLLPFSIFPLERSMKINRDILHRWLPAAIFPLLFFFSPLVQASNTEGNNPPLSLQLAQPPESVAASRTLHVRGDHNYPPYEYSNDQGQPEGFNVDIINAVAKAMGLKIKIDLGPWQEVMAQLEKGEIDALIGMFETRARDEKFDFSIPHFIASCAVFVREGSSIQSLVDVKNKKILVQAGDLAHEYLIENQLSPNIIAKKDWAEVLKSLAKGEGDCAIVSRLQGTRLIGTLSLANIKAVGPPIIQRKYCLAVTEGDSSLLAKLNEGLSIIKEAGTYDEIYKKWFGVYEEQPLPFVKVFNYLIWIILPLLALAIGGFLWSWTLKKQVALRTIALRNELLEHRRTEAALQESEARFRNLLENIPSVAVQGYGMDGTTQYWNRASEELYGYTAQEAIGRNLLDLIIPDAMRDDFAKVLRHMAETEEPVPATELSLKHKDGSRVRVFSSLAIVKKTKGPPELFCIDIDITERERAEEALRTSNELLSLFIKHSPIYAFIKEVTPDESRVLKASENYQDMIGIPGSAMAGKTMQELFPVEFAAKMAADDWLVVSRGEILHLDEDFNGRSYTTIKFPILLEGTNFLAGYTIDLTERKRAEEELRRRENQLQKILEILPIGLWFADKEGTLLRGNPMGMKIWAADPNAPISELGNFKAWSLPSREPVRAEDWALAKTIRSGVTIVDELLEIEAFDGRRKTILNYTAPVLDEYGKVDGAIVVNLDISDRKTLEDQLLQAQKMESIGRLAGGVAHDFNNMLSVILGQTELVMDSLDPAQPLFARLQNIREAAQRSADLTRQLLAFARRQTVSPKVFDLNETVEGMLKMLRRLIGEDIDLVWLPGGNLGSIKMDPSQLDQILVNLCVNARDASGDTGKVTIETSAVACDGAYCAAHAGFVPGAYAQLTVSDSGYGMDPETVSHLFEPFFTTKETGKGTGLGLATVYGIVKQNNGFINVYSEPGQGTSFKIYLPRDEAGAEWSAKTNDEEPAAPGSETILLVEDEPMILEMTTGMLEYLGYTVLTATAPNEAILLARKHAGEIRLLMTDVVMPGMNGRDLARNLVALRPNLSLLFMSGYTANVIAHHGVLDQGVHFIQKPFSLKDLAAKVRETLDADSAVEDRQPMDARLTEG